MPCELYVYRLSHCLTESTPTLILGYSCSTVGASCRRTTGEGIEVIHQIILMALNKLLSHVRTDVRHIECQSPHRMGKACCAPGCVNRFVKGNGIKFYRFPADLDRRRRWIAALNRKDWQPSEYNNYLSYHVHYTL